MNASAFAIPSVNPESITFTPKYIVGVDSIMATRSGRRSFTLCVPSSPQRGLERPPRAGRATSLDFWCDRRDSNPQDFRLLDFKSKAYADSATVALKIGGHGRGRSGTQRLQVSDAPSYTTRPHLTITNFSSYNLVSDKTSTKTRSLLSYRSIYKLLYL